MKTLEQLLDELPENTREVSFYLIDGRCTVAFNGRYCTVFAHGNGTTPTEALQAAINKMKGTHHDAR